MKNKTSNGMHLAIKNLLNDGEIFNFGSFYEVKTEKFQLTIHSFDTNGSISVFIDEAYCKMSDIRKLGIEFTKELLKCGVETTIIVRDNRDKFNHSIIFDSALATKDVRKTVFQQNVKRFVDYFNEKTRV